MLILSFFMGSIKLSSSSSLIMVILSMESMSLFLLFMMMSEMIVLSNMINFLTIMVTLVMESVLAICIMMKFFILTNTSGSSMWSTSLQN